MLAFKKGAFRVAIDQQLPILPMTVVGTRDVLPADSLRIRPGRVRLIIHPPISTEGLKLTDLRRLSDQVRLQVASGLDRESVD